MLDRNSEERPASAPFRVSPQVALLLGFCVFAVAPLTAPGYFIYAHDARHSVYFLQMFDQSIRDGAWFPRWAADMTFGYGYPLWLILAPIPFYVGEAFHLVGFDFVSSVKIVDGLAMVGSALTMYLFASRVLGKNAGLLAGIAYVYIPYHLVDLYVRASQAEFVAYVFPPLVLWAFQRLHETRQARFIPAAALAYAGLVLTHIQAAFLFTPIIGLYLVVLFLSSRPAPRAWRFAIASAAAIALSLGVAAIFLLPVFFEQRYLTTDPLIGGFFDFRSHFLNPNQLLSPFWGYGYAGVNGADQFSLQLGLIPALISLVGLAGLFRSPDRVRGHIALFGAVAAGAILMTLPISSPIWELFSSIIAYVQFPWRLLSVSTLGLAFLCGAAVYALPAEARDLGSVLATALIFVCASYTFTEPHHTDAVFNYQTQMEFEVKNRELLGDTIWMAPGDRPQSSPLVDEYVNGEPLQKAYIAEGQGSVQMIRHGGQSDEVRVTANQPVSLILYTRYFPGWAATLDGQPVNLRPCCDQGLIEVQVPAGAHDVAARFGDTPVRQVAAVVSAVSLLIALGSLRLARARLI